MDFYRETSDFPLGELSGGSNGTLMWRLEPGIGGAEVQRHIRDRNFAPYS